MNDTKNTIINISLKKSLFSFLNSLFTIIFFIQFDVSFKYFKIIFKDKITLQNLFEFHI